MGVRLGRKRVYPCEQMSSPRWESITKKVRSRTTLSEFRDKAREESKVRLGSCQEFIERTVLSEVQDRVRGQM